MLNSFSYCSVLLTRMDQQTTSVPQWIDQSYFLEILKDSVPHFSKIQQFDVKPALRAGENYGSLMLRVKICIELKGELRRGLQVFTFLNVHFIIIY